MKHCKTIESWMVDYGDGTLSPAQADQMRAHMAECLPCANAVRDMQPMRELLQGLDRIQTSPQFDAALAARLARTQSRSFRRSWSDWLGALRAPTLLRPALALGAVTCAIAGALFLHTGNTPVAAPPPGVDAALISQCVAVHQRDVAAQPLTDPTAPGIASASSNWSGATTMDSATQDNF